ncbi:flavin reductase family protein [Ancylobacter vacuolatus]|uniref:Flavin reductase (DIM6/NTAB) family NADH-FMN oxidoreductase RutF n=1 Tax=Ancylobacter vacuolatus TaxID=223389 RepID=A0ABU0DKU4_9HYPH|nr:flavin reductase family protein [Ancylobacter vacuolatus]MDQ0349025.1 flavin reductase (DIM6/NTAB) family NADH-FMN oxidoreductase RutF [Ancylobacter vacuolatus]
MQTLALDQVYRLIEPGPVVLLTTSWQGRANVMTMSWHMMVEFTPPLIACVVSENDFSFRALKASGECVIAIPTVELAEKVVAVGNCSGRDGDKFARTGLTPLPAAEVAAPLVKECFANLECRVVDTTLRERYNVLVLEVVKAWTDPAQKAPRTLHHRGFGHFVLDGEAINLPSKMP